MWIGIKHVPIRINQCVHVIRIGIYFIPICINSYYYYTNSFMWIGINCYTNWYISYQLYILLICICKFVCMSWYKTAFGKCNKKTTKSKKRDSPLSPGMWESVRSLPNSLRYHLFSHKRKPKNHLKPEIVRIQLVYI